MKKRKLTSLQLHKECISIFESNNIKGGQVTTDQTKPAPAVPTLVRSEYSCRETDCPVTMA